ncbi:MAG: ABC transporter ATP-binding protein [Oscillospiraceae bacterium]
MNNAIETRGLTKHFKDFTLDSLDLELPEGCILGLIGENGAGKTTAIKLLLGILKPDSGTASVLGQDISGDMSRVKEDVGVVLDEPGLPEKLTLRQLEKIMPSIYKSWSREDFSHYIRRMELPEDKPYKEFSRGMKMKLGLVLALSHKPRLLLLDEATSGLDPVVRDSVTDLLLDFTRDKGHSVLISSHIVSDLEKLCDYIAFLHKGKLMLLEEKDALMEEYGLLQCSRDEAERIDPSAIIGRRDNPYGSRLIVRTDALPRGTKTQPVSIEELFVFMVKEDI